MRNENEERKQGRIDRKGEERDEIQEHGRENHKEQIEKE